MSPTPLRHLVIVLGDQLDVTASAFDDFDARTDAVWMAEVDQESTHVWSSKSRIAVFLSAMRHFAQAQRELGRRVLYTEIDAADNTHSLSGELQRALEHHAAQGLVMTAPGDWRVLHDLKAVAQDRGLPLEIRDDRHFITTVRDFKAHAAGRKQLRLEYFYREVRRKTGLLMAGDQPEGGQWNFDADNRKPFAATGPGPLPTPARFKPDAITESVIALVKTRFADHPGGVDDFAWPMTREEALQALDQFIRERLPQFGAYQDAMWPGEVWLYHSHLSVALNLKLLHPLEVAQAAQAAYQQGHAPIESVEGFIRQVVGWREYVRGIYWLHMPDYLERNALGASEPLPELFWTAQTDMACLRDALQLTLQHGYAHHIQRLMITGLYALLLGVDPKAVHGWYLSVYVDAVEWVELPNTLGMSQFADGGLMASKPYVASGKYIQRMSPHCAQCRYKPDVRVGETACPYTTLYWDFLIRHEDSLARNPRMLPQVRNAQRLDEPTRQAIQDQAQSHRKAVRQGQG